MFFAINRELIKLGVALFSLAIFFSGCATAPRHAGGTAAHYVDPGQQSEVSGVGIESQDIINMTDKMMSDILATPLFFQTKTHPKVIIDAEYFKNESSTRINKNMITDRLRTELNRAARGKMIFIGREYLNMMLKELQLKQLGVINEGESTSEPKAYGGDFRLGGRISTMDSVDPKTGSFARYHQILFEMIDLNTSEIVWSGSYNFKKVGQEDIIYR
ncbi:MAG TPA: penicillin-binding protein activator LpoB [Anaerolineae bacterium]|nr:penicillin-binding protein activator LpoB [Anaerolineae bacterium]